MEQLKDRIKKLRGKETQDSFSSRFSVHRNTISQYERGESVPDANFILQLANEYSVSTDWIIYGKETTINNSADNDFTYIPLVAAELSAGNGSLLDSKEIIDFFAFKKDWIKNKGKIKDLVLMKVMGDSMEPTLANHDLVMINISKTKPYPGTIFAVAYDDSVYIKRLVTKPGQLILKSDNSYYDDIIININDEAEVQTIKIIGRAVWWCHDEIV